MTAGHDGTPENDDPFAYLYRSEGGEQPDPAGGQPRMPRTSYNQVQRVGERRTPPPQAQPGGYGYPQPQQGYGRQYGTPPQQYGAGPQQYTGATQQYAAAPQQPPQGQAYGDYGTREYTGPQQPPPGGGHRGGPQGGGPDAPNRKGLLIAAVAVVAAVAIGIAFAMTNGSGDDKKHSSANQQTTAPVTSSTAPSTQPTPTATPTQFDSGKTDAATLTLGGGAQQSNQWPGAAGSGGTYVDHMAQPGASATWTVNVPEDGPYTFFISYGNAGTDANLTLGVNGTPRSDAVNLRNYGGATDWSKAWGMHTYSWVDLKKGANTLSLTCGQDQQCGVNLDQVWLKQGHVTK